jgi:hypothetical protein
MLAATAYAGLGLVDRSEWHAVASTVGLALAGSGYGLGFSPLMTIAVSSVPPRRARDASGIMTTTIQVSYAVGLTALGSLFLAQAQHSGANASGHGFTSVGIFLAGLALLGAALALVLARRSGALSAARLLPAPLRGEGRPGGAALGRADSGDTK